MCFTSINKDNIVIPMLDNNMYLLCKEFLFTSPGYRNQLNAELNPVFRWDHTSEKKTYVFVKYRKDIMCLRNDTPQTIIQVFTINNIGMHIGCTMTAGFHCYIKPKRKGVYFSMSDDTHSDAIYSLSLPVMVTRYDFQLCSQQDVVVGSFYLPSPWRLEKVLTKSNLKEYTKWYKKWSKQLCQEK